MRSPQRQVRHFSNDYPDNRVRPMIFEQVASGGCRSFMIGCSDTCAAALIDPELSQIDRYLALDGGMKSWREAGYAVQDKDSPDAS
jgi:hypothetical protein